MLSAAEAVLTIRSKAAEAKTAAPPYLLGKWCL
jgi:hypothetical protein